MCKLAPMSIMTVAPVLSLMKAALSELMNAIDPSDFPSLELSLATVTFSFPFFFLNLDLFFCFGPWPSFPPPLAQQFSIEWPFFFAISAYMCLFWWCPHETLFFLRSQLSSPLFVLRFENPNDTANLYGFTHFFKGCSQCVHDWFIGWWQGS